MKYIAAILLVLFNIINVPLSMLYMRVQKWYLPLDKKDPVMYYAFAPFYWILVFLTFLFGYPCEFLSELVH